jgi:hypothetical protein
LNERVSVHLEQAAPELLVPLLELFQVLSQFLMAQLKLVQASQGVVQVELARVNETGV